MAAIGRGSRANISVHHGTQSVPLDCLRVYWFRLSGAFIASTIEKSHHSRPHRARGELQSRTSRTLHAWRQSVCPSALTLALGEERLKGGDDLHKLLPA